MNKKAFVKLLAVLFAAMLAFSLGAVSAFAEEASTAEAVTYTVEADETDSADESDEATGVSFTIERLPRMLGYMGVGMLCIVIVMGVLIGVTVLLNKVTAPKDKSNA